MKLKQEFKKYGDLFEYIKHEGDWYIYKRTPYENDDGDTLSGVRSHFEVVRPYKRNSSANNTTKTGIIRKEYDYPSAAHWGQYGFTLITRERAEEKFNELI